MADNIMDVGPVDQSVGYGGTGSAQFYGIQKLLLQRQAQARQAALDEEQRQKDALDAEVKRANIASLGEQRKSAALENAAKTDALQSTQFERTHGVDADLTNDPTGQALALRLYGPNALHTQPAVDQQTIPAQAAEAAQPAVIGVPDETGAGAGHPAVAAKEATPETIVAPKAAKTTFAGTEAQQVKAGGMALAHSVLNGDHDTGDADVDKELHGWALSTLMTGKVTSLPAGVIKPKTPTETKAAHDLAMQALMTKIEQGYQPTPAEAAELKVWRSFPGGTTEAEKDAEAVRRINITVAAADKRQEAGFANKAVEGDYNDLRSDYTKNVEPFLQRSVKALDALKSPGGVNDVVAIPEFLSAMAGGQGSGLRMTQSELSMIQNARPGTESVWIKLQNLASGYTALDAQQRQQMSELVKSVATHQIERGDRYAKAMDEMSQAKSAVDSHKVRTDLMRTDLGDTRSSLGLPPAKSGGFDPAAARKKYNY
jgi:hypothetical protein